MQDIILEAKGIKKHFPIRKGFFMREVGQVKAVEEINLSVRRGETLGLVGESGCGKSTLGRTLIRLYEPTAGTIQFDGADFAALSGSDLRKKRRDIQMIFQDPYASLDSRMTVGQIVEQPFKIHGILEKNEREARVKQLLELVGLKASHVNRYPHEFSGGQRQRISIARAVALDPKLIICDEPVSALDVSIQAQVLNLLKDLQERLKLTYIFISHDLSVIEHVCDRIAVMYLGRIVELASRDELFSNPMHPYTRALMSSIPTIGTGKKKMQKILSGEIPSPINPPSGCAFHPRCSYKIDECSKILPPLLPIGNTEHTKACIVNLKTNLKEIL
ncbi:MAG: oligopeptide transporter, ATP-binding protein [Pseudobdellovibrio sp.]|jgi:oligopeptide transport system ATP-binding protein|nr:oligopeptide transporter, ATP-binding protein [Pseudobdellovibrio sp.]